MEVVKARVAVITRTTRHAHLTAQDTAKAKAKERASSEKRCHGEAVVMPILSKPILAAMGASLGTVGVMNVDVRPKLDESKLKDLDESRYADILKPGDVLVGAETTPDSAIENYQEAFRKNYVAARKKRGVAAALKQAITKTYPRSITSKIIDSVSSHAETVLDDETIGFIGGPKKKIRESINKDGAHFVVMRRKKDISVDRINEIVKKVGLNSGQYDRGSTLKAGLREVLAPDFNKTERDKNIAEKVLDKAIKSGNCATLPALVTDKTIGGKTTTNVLPADYTRSKDWEPVGYFGIKPSNVKAKFSNQLVYSAPKIIGQGAVAGAVGIGAFGMAKGFKAALKVLRKVASDDEVVAEFVKIARKSRAKSKFKKL